MKILVRNLDRAVTETEILELFKAFGKVETCVLVTDKDLQHYATDNEPNDHRHHKLDQAQTSLRSHRHSVRSGSRRKIAGQHCPAPVLRSTAQ